jgi:hypothetical protein
MTPKPLHTFLNTLLQSCHVSGTSVQESGITVSTERRTGETIDVFHTDGVEGRKCLKMEGQGERISDYLYYYTIKSEKMKLLVS